MMLLSDLLGDAEKAGDRNGDLRLALATKMVDGVKMEVKISDQENTVVEQQLVIASRWDRLSASLIDCLIMMIVTVPVMYLTGGFDGVSAGISPSMSYLFGMWVFSTTVFVVVNGKLLVTEGQTIGKQIMEIKMVTLSGELPGVKQHLLKRYGVYFLLGQIPFAGRVLSIINVLLIFGKQKRCGHDLVAGTKVVKCAQVV